MEPTQGQGGGLLRWHRERLMWSVIDLAKRSGVTRQTITMIENGRTRRSWYSTLRMLEDAMELPRGTLRPVRHGG